MVIGNLLSLTDFIVLYRTFDWLDSKMLESVVSVLTSDLLSLSGGLRFQ